MTAARTTSDLPMLWRHQRGSGQRITDAMIASLRPAREALAHVPAFAATRYELDPSVEPGRPMKARNSRRVEGSVRKAPSMRLVTIEVPGLCTPRVVMH